MAFFQCDYCNPRKLKQELDQFVMEQDKGTRAIASAIAQHLIQTERFDQGNTDNVVLIGPTGGWSKRCGCRWSSIMSWTIPPRKVG